MDLRIEAARRAAHRADPRRSAQVKVAHGGDNPGYSDLKVLRSGAGYYIGTTYTHGPNDEFPGLVEPGSRDSGYYPTREAAQAALDGGTYEPRLTP